MKTTLIHASKAAGVFNKLGEQMLPGKIAKVIFDNRKMLMHHVEFLAEEEQKLIRAYGAESGNGVAFHVPDDEEKNNEFISKIRDLQNIAVEFTPILIEEDALLTFARIAPNDIEFIDYIFEVQNTEGSEEDEQHADV